MRGGSLLVWDSRLAHGNFASRSRERSRFVFYLTYAPAMWHEADAMRIRRAALESGGQYSNRWALFHAFSAVTHSLGTSQDITMRRRKCDELRAKQAAGTATMADTALLARLESELRVIGDSNTGGERLLPAWRWRCTDGAFSNRIDYYAPKRLDDNGALQPYFQPLRGLSPLGQHVAGVRRLNAQDFRRALASHAPAAAAASVGVVAASSSAPGMGRNDASASATSPAAGGASASADLPQEHRRSRKRSRPSAEESQDADSE
jgi:hypothetical protein